VHSPAIRLTTLGVTIPAIYRLETLAVLVLNDHAYDKLTGWSNVIPVVPVKGDATENSITRMSLATVAVMGLGLGLAYLLAEFS